MKIIFATLVLAGITTGMAIAQQSAQYSQYMFNGLILNPAYAGADEALSLTFVNRSQWVSVDGAPVTQSFSAHTLFDRQHLGVGLTVVNDKIGVHRNQQAAGVVSYQLKVAEKSVLSFGMQAGINIQKSNYAALNTGNAPLDVNYNGNVSQAYFNVGMGVYYRSPKLDVGFSVPALVPQKSVVSDSVTIHWRQANYFLFARYRIRLNDMLALEPSVLLKYHQGVPLSYDINACLVIKKALTVGASYRKSESLDFLLKAQVTPQLQLGYSYDFVIGTVSALSRGTHELMVNYVFRYTHTKITSPR
jgi:type IX secretion system PorP/SprF family membrane protein